MDCRSFERSIDAFLSDDMETDELDEFLGHAEECSECREELTIRLLISLGLKRLEDGRTFNLGDEYDRTIQVARTRLRRRNFLQRVAGLSIGAVILALVSVIVVAAFVLVV